MREHLLGRMSLYLFLSSAPGGTSAIVTRLDGIDWTEGKGEREGGGERYGVRVGPFCVPLSLSLTEYSPRRVAGFCSRFSISPRVSGRDSDYDSTQNTAQLQNKHHKPCNDICRNVCVCVCVSGVTTLTCTRDWNPMRATFLTTSLLSRSWRRLSGCCRSAPSLALAIWSGSTSLASSFSFSSSSRLRLYHLQQHCPCVCVCVRRDQCDCVNNCI